MTDISESQTIALPPPRRSGPCGLESLMWRRRTLRDYGPEPLSLSDLGQLLWAGGGLAEEEGKCIVPSAGALYPLRLFAAARQVEDLAAGLYSYEPAVHALALRRSGDFSGEIEAAGIGLQPWLATAPAVLIVAGNRALMVDHFRPQPPEGARGLRYLAMEAGAAGQSIALQATALELGTVYVGGFDDNRVSDLLNLSDEEDPLALIAVGGLPPD